MSTNFCIEVDWKARADVAKLLKHLKKELTLLVVSHDLKLAFLSSCPSSLSCAGTYFDNMVLCFLNHRELAPLVDRSWRMEGGGVLIEEPLSL